MNKGREFSSCRAGIESVRLARYIDSSTHYCANIMFFRVGSTLFRVVSDITIIIFFFRNWFICEF